MSKARNTRIWNVGYSTTRPSVEVLSLVDLRSRALQAREAFLRPQRVHFELLVMVTAGLLHHTVDFVDHYLRPGDVLWVRSGQVQEWETFDDRDATQDAGVAATVALFEPDRVDERARDLCGTRAFWPADNDAHSPVERCRDELVATANRTLPHPEQYEELAGRRLSLLVAELAYTSPPNTMPKPHEGSDLFSRLTAAIDRDYATARTTDTYARALGYSTRTLNRCAIRHTGTSVKQMIDARTLLEAKRLLAHETSPAVAVGRAVGFDDPTAFSRFFRHRTGMSPLQFRTTRTTRG